MEFTHFFLLPFIIEKQQKKCDTPLGILGRIPSEQKQNTVEALANLKKGDLIFFGSKATPEKKERVTHVGIYIENGIFIHSAGKVRINSLIPTDDNYYSGSKRLIRACRIIGNQDMDKDILTIEKLYK